MVFYFLKKDPELLERRMRMREKIEKTKDYPDNSELLFFSLGFLIPGLDYRYHWSNVPVYSLLLQQMPSFCQAIYFVFLVLRKIVMLPGIIEVQNGQKVITTGPYATVRHPMYLGVLVM